MTTPPGFASRLFVTGALAFVLIGILGALYGVSLPAFTRAFGLREGAAALILTVGAAGAVLTVGAQTFGLGGLSARLSMFLMAVGAGLVSAGASWPLTLLGAFIGGAGFGIIATHVNRAFLTGFGPRGPAMVGLVNAISGAGLIAGPLLYLALGKSPTLAFGGVAVLAVALFFLFEPAAAPVAAPEAAPAPRRRGGLAVVALNHVSAWLESGLGGLGAVALISLGHSEEGAARLVSGFFAAFLLSRLSLYWISRVIPADRTFLIATLGTAGAAALAAAGWPALGYVLAGGFVGMAFPSVFVWGSAVFGPDPRMQASILLAGLLGGAIGPLVLGLLLTGIGLPQLFVVVTVLGAVLSVLVLAVIGALRRTPPAGAAA